MARLFMVLHTYLSQLFLTIVKQLDDVSVKQHWNNDEPLLNGCAELWKEKHEAGLEKGSRIPHETLWDRLVRFFNYTTSKVAAKNPIIARPSC